jgi:hypothetical protein
MLYSIVGGCTTSKRVVHVNHPFDINLRNRLLRGRFLEILVTRLTDLLPSRCDAHRATSRGSYCSGAGGIFVMLRSLNDADAQIVWCIWMEM